MLMILAIIACTSKDLVITPDSPIDTGEPLPDVAAVTLEMIDDDTYAEPLFRGGYLYVMTHARDVILRLDPAAYPAYQPWRDPVGQVTVAALPGTRTRYLEGVGLWLAGDYYAGSEGSIVDLDSLTVLRTARGGVDIAMHGGALVTAYPGVWQMHSMPNEAARLEAINADGSTSTLRTGLCGDDAGYHCGDGLAVVDGVLWWADYLGGLYTEGDALHLDDGALLPGAPEYVSGEAAPHNRIRLLPLGDGRLWVGGVIDCGAIYDTRSGSFESYGTAEGCGFYAVEGVSTHGSRVRVVALDLSIGGGYGALRVEWLDGDHAGEMQEMALPFPEPAYSCYPIPALGPSGELAVSCDGNRGLFVGLVTG